jgi:glucose-6-phosphate 1-dehydrogenase
LCPIEASAVQTKTVRGQYRAGAVNGQPVPGCLDEAGVAGSWGPAASSALISRDGFAWQDET